jgi:hypothetical protein
MCVAGGCERTHLHTGRTRCCVVTNCMTIDVHDSHTYFTPRCTGRLFTHSWYSAHGTPTGEWAHCETCTNRMHTPSLPSALTLATHMHPTHTLCTHMHNKDTLTDGDPRPGHTSITLVCARIDQAVGSKASDCVWTRTRLGMPTTMRMDPSKSALILLALAHYSFGGSFASRVRKHKSNVQARTCCTHARILLATSH